MCSFRISRDGPAVIPCLGPRSHRRPRSESVKNTYDGEISKRITDPNLLKSLSRDTSIKIRPPQTGDKISRSSQSSSPRLKPTRTYKEQDASSNVSYKSNKTENNKNRNSDNDQDKNIRQNPRFPKYTPSTYRRHIDKPDLDEMAESYMYGKSKNEEEEEEEENLSIEDCRSIKAQLKKLRAYLIQEEDYNQALIAHQKMIQLDGKIWELDHYTDELYGMRHRMTRHQEIEQVVKIYLEDWESSYSEFLKCVQMEADQIEEENLKELEDFNSQIPEELEIGFRKPSKKLMDIRSAERRLALDNQIPIAIKLKKMGDQMEQVEAERAYEKQKRLINERRKRLIKAQKERIKVFYDHINSVKITLIQQRDKLIKGYLFRLHDLDKKLDKDSEELKVKIENYCNSRLNEERLEYVQKEELGTPTPRARPGVGYSISVKKRKANSSTEKVKTKPSKKSTLAPIAPKQYKTATRRKGIK
ncbi:hypothetical protein M9Y10_024096 [Tritrichomonas musculus]|uniref:Uncharacterized protein n=1 Tax=Tritrichomonas musculus TaxID=1915356 RepID=A0ABR2KXS8_9EUKA